MNYFTSAALTEGFMNKACFMHLNSRMDIPFRAQALVSKEDLRGEAILSLADGRMKAYQPLYDLLSDESFLSKLMLTYYIGFKQLLLDIYIYVMKHCHL